MTMILKDPRKSARSAQSAFYFRPIRFNPRSIFRGLSGNHVSNILIAGGARMKFKFDVFFNSAVRVVCFASALLMGAGSAAALYTHPPLNQYARGVWQTENGLPQNTIHRVIQTRDGYIWVATDGGLARFDGLSFSVFDKQNTPALGSNQIRGVSEDSDGNLWICTPEGLIR